MMSKIEEPTHPYLETIKPYQPPDLETVAARADLKMEQLVRLNANENAFGPPPQIAQSLADYADYAYYPHYPPLREAIAHYAGVSSKQVVLGNGADEIIDLLIRLFVEPGQAIVICPPTFGSYRFFAKVSRCRTLSAPRQADFSLDAAAVEKKVLESEGEARLLFLASPHNPSGQNIPLSTIRRLLALPLMVAVDEAYIEFCGESAAPLLERYENLTIIRTFSKWAGMAGLRLGYALLAPRLAGHLERIRAPYNVNAATVAAALATLEDLEAAQANVNHTIAERERLRGELAKLPYLHPYPTQTNFVLCRVVGRDAHELKLDLERAGILIRYFDQPGLHDHVRISVGRSEQTDALVAELWRL